MNRKLTLSMDGEIIDAAKEKASETGLSLSSFITQLLLEQINSQPIKKKRKRFSPLIEKLSGIINLNDPKIKNDDYAQYLLNKDHPLRKK